MQDKTATHGGNMGSTGGMNRGSPLLGGTASAKPTWQESPQKSTQSAGGKSKLNICGCFQLNIRMKKFTGHISLFYSL